MRVLVAPDKFKGTLTAAEAARAIAAGWQRGAPGDQVETVPLADGGDGTLDALVAGLGGERHTATVTGPLGDPVRAEYGLVPADGRTMGVVEMAQASGLTLIPPSRRDPKRTTTRGTGELILAVAAHPVGRILVCVGGSATNDGGVGMAQTLGIRFLDEQGRDLPPGGEALLRLARIDASGLHPSVRQVKFTVATDVDNPLVGPHGASAVYGPQKGASPEDVLLLDRALRHLAAVIYRDLGVDVRDIPGAGAAGGLGAGLIAFLGASVRSGVDVVMEAVRLGERLEHADLLVTGEGTFDEQSLRGKAPAGALRAAEELRVRAIVLCGQATVRPQGIQVLSMAERFGVEAALERPRDTLERLAAQVAEDLLREAGGKG